MISIFYQLQKDSGNFKSNYVNVGVPTILNFQVELNYIASLKELIKTANPRALKDVDDVHISMCQEGVKEFDYKSLISDIDKDKILLVRYAEVAPVVGKSHAHIIRYITYL